MRYWSTSNVFCIAMGPALTLPMTGVLESTGCLSWRFLGPALTLPITGVLLLLIIIIKMTATNIHSDCIYSSPYFVFLSRKSPHTAGSRLHNMTPCCMVRFSDCIHSSPYFVFFFRKSPDTAGSRLHNMTPCYRSTWLYIRYNYSIWYVIIIMLSAYMRYPGWSTGGPASLLVGSRPRTQIHTKCYCTECIPPILFAYIYSFSW